MLRLDLERCPYVVADSSRSLAQSTQTSWSSQQPSLGQGRVQRRAARGFAPLQSRTDSAVILPAAMAGCNTGLVLCQVSGQ
jgi:hypothetical protein